MHPLVRDVASAPLIARTGRVVSVQGNIVEAAGPAAQVGELCRIGSPNSRSPIAAEVIGFNRGVTVLMPFAGIQGIAAGESVVARGALPDVPVGPELLGRVLDPFGTPIDDRGPLKAARRRSLSVRPPRAM